MIPLFPHGAYVSLEDNFSDTVTNHGRAGMSHEASYLHNTGDMSII